MDELTRFGVDIGLVRVDSSLKTGITASFSAEDRALATFPGAIAELRAGEIAASILTGFSHLHVSSYYLQRGLQPGLPGLFRAARQGGTDCLARSRPRSIRAMEPGARRSRGALRCSILE
jgi:sugar/nucleoside kinase (ribokinase family)